MRTRCDRETDTLYIRFAEAEVSDSEEVRPGIVLDFDAQGRMVGLEVLDASEHRGAGADLRQLSAA